MSVSSLFKCSLLTVSIIAAGCATNGSVGPNNNTAVENTNSYPRQNEGNSLCRKEDTSAQKRKTPSSGQKDLPSNQTGMSPQETLDLALEFCQTSNDYWQRGDLENALDALDQAYSLILSVNSRDASPELLQQKDDLRFTISKRIAEVYASRFTVANGDHKAIPLDMNPHVERAISLFQGSERTFFLNAYRRSGRYRPAIVRALKEAGMPEELSWLPLIESGYKTKALSRARALGMWQFIASTGYKFGLSRDQWVDERMDIEKSTAAAIAYMKELHQIFGDWATVLAAYNCGEGRVLKVISRQRINYLDNFWDLYTKLPSETAFYVPKFLAVLHIVNNPEAYGITLPPLDEELQYETATVDKRVHLKTIAKNLDVGYEDLKDLNPALRQLCTPDRPYDIKVPRGKGELLLANIDALPVWTPPTPAYVIHKVRRGDTLSVIAKKYRTSVSKIKAANGLRRDDYLKVGWKLRIPTKGSAYAGVQPAAQPTYAVSGKNSMNYVVRKGDSLYKIARQFDTTIRAIQTLNHLTNADLRIGQHLRIPTSAASVAFTKTKPYKVRKGDSAYEIASKHQMSLADFLSINCLTPRSTIYPGQTLLVRAQ